MEGLNDHKIIQDREVEQVHDREATEREYQVTEVLKNRRIPQQEIQSSDDDLLDKEKDNAANASILDRDTTIIFLKRMVGNSHDVSKPAKD